MHIKRKTKQNRIDTIEMIIISSFTHPGTNQEAYICYWIAQDRHYSPLSLIGERRSCWISIFLANDLSNPRWSAWQLEAGSKVHQNSTNHGYVERIQNTVTKIVEFDWLESNHKSFSNSSSPRKTTHYVQKCFTLLYIHIKVQFTDSVMLQDICAIFKK